MADTASAQPQKRLFLDLLTRDITLEDAILDLIDNSINSVIVNQSVDLPAVFDNVISGDYDYLPFDQYLIEIEVSEAEFSLKDNCGGIRYQDAKHHVFKFGREKRTAPATDTLSVYGIGLKRALFKLGNEFQVQSHRDKSFEVAFSAKWFEGEEDWSLPLAELPADALPEGDTFIRVSDLRPETKERIAAPEFEASLIARIQQTYCFFVDRFCRISINGRKVPSRPIEVGAEENLQPAVQAITEGGVQLTVVAGLAPKRDDRWVTEDAGWYVFCNGRAVIFGDKTRLTGWGRGLPMFVSKFRGFRGLAFFFSRDPELLPWTTTKTDVNQEAVIYQRALNIMYTASRPVINFLNSLYSEDEAESESAKAAVDAVTSRPLTRVVSLESSTFQPPTQREATTISVQFRAKIGDLEKVRQHLRRPTLSGRAIADIALKYYLENEVG